MDISSLRKPGGLSFLSGQYGWASTHVLEYEVVLANGTVAKASKTVNPDLHRALQGGGSAFGVVTSFNLTTVPIGQVRHISLVPTSS
jgi:FAD/FMN-containing dehydrogenase